MNEIEQLTEAELFEKYEYLVITTIYKKFKEPRKLALSLGIDLDDIQQFGRLGLLRGIRTFDPKFKLKLKNHLIANIKYGIMNGLRDESITHRYYKAKPNADENKVAVVSMSANPYFKDDDDTFYDIVANDNIFSVASSFPNPESSTISKSVVDRLFDKLTEKEKKIVKMRLKEDLTFQEIADRLGYSKQNIGMIFKKMYTYSDYFNAIAEVR